VVSENVFSQYIYKTLPTHSHLWMFKKTFCRHMALSGARWRDGNPACAVFAAGRAVAEVPPAMLCLAAQPALTPALRPAPAPPGLLCHALFLGGRQPGKIMFARDTGRVFQTDMMPLYNDRWGDGPGVGGGSPWHGRRPPTGGEARRAPLA
jgi:transformation/transcription domain-associated protein